MYLMVCTRYDIAYALGALCRFLANPGLIHWKAGKRVLRYLKNTPELGCVYTKKLGQDKDSFTFFGYTDSSHADDLDKRRSSIGYLFLASGGPIDWVSRLYPSRTLSVTGAEIAAATEGAVRIALTIGRFQRGEHFFEEDGDMAH